MNHKVHQIAGVVIGQGALLYHHTPAFSLTTIGVMFCGYAAAMFPDLDKPGSFFTQHQPFRAFSEGMSRIGVPHRGPTHSLPALILVYLLFKFVIELPDVYLWAIVLGYASHIFLDLFNAAGVMLLFPWRFDFKLLPSFMAVSSEDYSVTQLLIFTVLSGVFYAMLANTMLDILSNTPLVGHGIGRLRLWALDKTEPIWRPIVHSVVSLVQGFQRVVKI
ncbi:metal-dependent hydrolase [Cohnella sp. GCM10020058]|uniref:metal-dependent hydrolase n=1 Tax=Cohnella sp. GCM10020058 TaxID=3317330 RepID=UPI00362670D8